MQPLLRSLSVPSPRLILAGIPEIHRSWTAWADLTPTETDPVARRNIVIDCLLARKFEIERAGALGHIAARDRFEIRERNVCVRGREELRFSVNNA